MKIPELLAPAGNKEAFYAAVANGADAVYVGGKLFSARAQADNFSQEELAAAVAYAHFYGVKVYCAINTLIADAELPAALEQVKYLYDISIDAVIVQDYGLFCAIKQLLPALAVNASTQMTVHNPDGAQHLRQMGASRIILARELSTQDIKAVCDSTDCEVEVFVHGALCVCYSGQCLMSSMIGGRSGNRGRCAQPCRLPYALTDGAGREIEVKSGEYLLSPKDLFGITALDELLATGVDSLKIEGRMKRSEYVAVVTDNYRRLLDARRDGADFDEAASLAELKQIFNRDYGAGWLRGNPGGELCSGKKPNNRGVFLGRVLSCEKNRLLIQTELPLRSGDGLEIWVTRGGRTGFLAEDMRVGGQRCSEAPAGAKVELNFNGRAFKGDRIFKTNDSSLMEKANASLRSERTMPLAMRLKARRGEYVELTATDARGYAFTAVDESYKVAAAQKRPADYEYIKAQLARLGGSGYRLEKLECEADGNIMLPASVLNNLRRSCTEHLREYYSGRALYPSVSGAAFAGASRRLLQDLPQQRAQGQKLAVWCADAASARRTAAFADIVYLEDGLFSRQPLHTDYAALKSELAAQGAELVPVLPQIYLRQERGYWQEQIVKWREAGIKCARCDSLGALELAKQNGLTELYGGCGLNVFNSLSAQRLYEQGLSRLLLSAELSLPQISELHFGGEKEILVHGAAQLMLSQYCALGGALGGRTYDKACSMPCTRHNDYALKDKKGYVFPLRCDRFCRMHIFNARELCMLNDMPALRGCGAGVLVLDTRLHAPQEAARIAEAYRRALRGEDTEKLLTGLAEFSRSGFTKGHFYRGVCDGQ